MHPRAVFAAIATAIALCPTSATVLPLQRLSYQSSPSTSPLTTKILYHQGLISSNDTRVFQGVCDAPVMSDGELTAGYCVGLQTYAVSISRIMGVECVFRMFLGSALCEAKATKMMNVPIPSGEGSICLVTGVEDGGRFAKGGGFLACG